MDKIMTNQDIDAGELLHIIEENEIFYVITNALNDYDESTVLDGITYYTKLADVAIMLELGTRDKADIIKQIEDVFEVSLQSFDKYASVYELANGVAIEIWHREDKAKKEAEAKAKLAQAKTSIVSTISPPVAPVLGVLLIPSLETHGRFLAVHDISIEEAKVLARDFTAHTVSKRKTKNFNDSSDIVDDIEFFYNVIDFDKMKLQGNSDLDSLETSLQGLKISETRGVRGLRTLFVSKSGVVGVGTTVIFNPNWATKNYSDPNMLTLLNDIQEEFIG